MWSLDHRRFVPPDHRYRLVPRQNDIEANHLMHGQHYHHPPYVGHRGHDHVRLHQIRFFYSQLDARTHHYGDMHHRPPHYGGMNFRPPHMGGHPARTSPPRRTSPNTEVATRTLPHGEVANGQAAHAEMATGTSSHEIRTSPHAEVTRPPTYIKTTETPTDGHITTGSSAHGERDTVSYAPMTTDKPSAHEKTENLPAHKSTKSSDFNKTSIPSARGEMTFESAQNKTGELSVSQMTTVSSVSQGKTSSSFPQMTNGSSVPQMTSGSSFPQMTTGSSGPQMTTLTPYNAEAARTSLAVPSCTPSNNDVMTLDNLLPHEKDVLLPMLKMLDEDNERDAPPLTNLILTTQLLMLSQTLLPAFNRRLPCEREYAGNNERVATAPVDRNSLAFSRLATLYRPSIMTESLFIGTSGDPGRTPPQINQAESYREVRTPSPPTILDEPTIDMYCGFCEENGQLEDEYRSHNVHDENGRVVCPMLMSTICPRCETTGAYAHTISHCPLNWDLNPHDQFMPEDYGGSDYHTRTLS